MLAYVFTRKRVKGQSLKDAAYVGTIEEDGYIYFNDEMSYRSPTPANLTDKQTVAVTDVQIWYVVRNCWIRANFFTSIVVYAFQPDTMNITIDDNSRRIGDVENRMTGVENRMTTVEGTVNNLSTRVNSLDTALSNAVSTINAGIQELGQKSLGDWPAYGYGNGDVLLELYNRLVDCANWINSQGGSITIPSMNVWTSW